MSLQMTICDKTGDLILVFGDQHFIVQYSDRDRLEDYLTCMRKDEDLQIKERMEAMNGINNRS